jgi:queuine/archaeosine tRNA-ribosyltransferase
MYYAVFRKYLKPSEYAARITIDQPHIAIAMADEIPLTSTTKRTLTAAKRTTEWFKEMLDYRDTNGIGMNLNITSLFGVVPGSLDDSRREQFIHTLIDLGNI